MQINYATDLRILGNMGLSHVGGTGLHRAALNPRLHHRYRSTLSGSNDDDLWRWILIDSLDELGALFHGLSGNGVPSQQCRAAQVST